MKPRREKPPFSIVTAAILGHAADSSFDAEFRRDMWRDAVRERHFDYLQAGAWWWPLPRRIAMAKLRELEQRAANMRNAQ